MNWHGNMCGNLSCYKEKYLVIGLEGFDEWFSRQPGSWDGRWWQMVFYCSEILPPFLDLPPLQKQGIMKFGESDHCLYYLKMWRHHLKAAEKKFKGDCDRSRKPNRAVMPSLVCLAKQSPDQSETPETVRDKHSRRPLPLPLSSRWTTYDRLRGARR